MTVIRNVAEKMFLDKNSPWHPVSLDDLRAFITQAETPLSVSAFREQVLSSLNDTTVMGWPIVQKDGHINVVAKENYRPSPDSAGLSKSDYHVCDYYASELAKVGEFPDFKLAWPQDRRDAALAACRAFLMQYRKAYDPHPSQPWERVHNWTINRQRPLARSSRDTRVRCN